jgi:hypothetical protein
MAKRDFKLTTLESFTGGLNLRADQFDLAQNESSDMLNVSVDPRGGVAMRKGIDRRNPSAVAADVKGIWGFHTDGGTNQLMVNYGTAVAHSASGNFTALTNITARTAGSRVYGTTFNNIAYGGSYDKVSFKWDGSTDADLGTTLDGTTGNMPKAQYVAVWNNFVWVGNTYEGADTKSRLRWSNLNDAEKWSASDYVDVDKGERGDYITGLVAHGDRLVVCKNDSTYAVFGFDSDSFQVVTLSNTVGSIALSSPVSTPYGVFMWYGESGVYLYDGERFHWVFDKLQPAIDDGRISFANPPQLAWANNRLYVSVDWTAEAASLVRRTFIYDPSLGEGGAWTATNVDAGPLYAYRPPNTTPIAVAGCVANTGSVIHMDAEDSRVTDRYVATEAHIDSHFVTPWVTSKNPIVKKRWGKARLITLASASITLGIQVFRNFDKAEAYKTFDVEIAGRDSTSVWDTAEWDDSAVGSSTLAIWAAADAATIADIKRLPTIGTAQSVSMRIDGPKTTNHTWELNAVAFTYIPRRLR